MWSAAHFFDLAAVALRICHFIQINARQMGWEFERYAENEYSIDDNMFIHEEEEEEDIMVARRCIMFRQRRSWHLGKRLRSKKSRLFCRPPYPT
jgi:hypothetical protein